MRSQYFKRVLLFSIIIIAFYSCNSLGKIGIEISVPPKYPLSSDIQSIAILNRSMTRNFTNLQRDSLERILVNKGLNVDTIFLDSIAADTTIQVAAKALFESERFDVVIPLERNIRRDDNEGILSPLDSAFVNDICNNFNVNGVLVLENFSEKITTDFNVEKFNVGFESGRYIKEYSGVINLSYKMDWRFYQPKLNPPVLRFEVRDTIFWDSYDYSIQKMYEKLPSLKEALIGGGIASGLDMAGYISPKWMDDNRKYYITGNKYIDAAIPLIKMNKWEEAAEIWMKYASASPKSLRSKVEYNLALASEMTGDFDLAIEWGLKSFKTKYSREAELYLKYLDLRRSALSKAPAN